MEDVVLLAGYFIFFPKADIKFLGLFAAFSVKLAGGRGMNVGYIYNQSGELAITATQEALIRKAPTAQDNIK